MDHCPQTAGIRAPIEPWLSLRAERCSTDRRSIFMILRQSRDRVSGSQSSQQRTGTRTVLATPLLREGVADRGDYDSPNRSSSVHRQADRTAQNLRRPGRDRHRERAACSKNSRSATRNCARRWSIRRQRPRCSASSAARRRTCSRCSTRSSRARRGFVGLMTWCCDSARGTLMVPRAHFGPIPIGRVEISIDEPQFRWMREHGTLHIPDVRAQNDFPTLGSVSGSRAPSWSFPFVSKGNSLER